MNIMKDKQLSETDILNWLKALRANAYVPESSFAVSAVFRVRRHDTDDYYFAGVNAENIDHRLSTHAEEGCIAAMVTALGPQAEIMEVWVMGAPKGAQNTNTLPSCCGKCRQQIAGFAAPDVKVHYLAQDGRSVTTTVGEFLPQVFTFRDYMPDMARAQKASPDLAGKDIKERLIREHHMPEKEIFHWLKSLESLDPVSKTSQSIVIKLDNGAYVAGTKIEEAAFISINAAQCAVAVAVSEFGLRKIQEAWVYTKGRDEKTIPQGSISGLTLSALQTLLQCAASDKIPIRFLAGDHSVTDMTLSEAAKLAPTSSHPFHKKPS